MEWEKYFLEFSLEHYLDTNDILFKKTKGKTF